MRRVDKRKPHSRRRLSQSQLAIEIENLGAVCPLSPDEITHWARELKGTGADRELRLVNLVTYWFAQAGSFHRQYEAARVQSSRFYRIDERLPKIAEQLTSICSELDDLPGDVDAALHIHFSEYEQALDNLALLPSMLNTIAEAWHRPRPGQPSLEMESAAIGLLICAIEDFTGETFPSPRSDKRLAELEFARLLAGRLFPSSRRPKINTMLRHFHDRRRGKPRGARPPRQGRQL